MKKILMIADLETWILGEIARKLQVILSKKMQIKILYSHETDFFKHFLHNCSESDVIHFLSPWDFFKLAKFVDKPCVFMLWHMVDWTFFKKYVYRIDTLCVGSQQWLEIVKDYTLPNIPLKRVHFGLDINQFQKHSQAKVDFISSHNLPENTLIFGFAGSAWSNEGNRKGLDRFFNCFLDLKDKLDHPFIIRIIGRYWTPEIIPTELQDFTKIELDLDHSQLPNFYSSLDYYLCTSRYEGVPYPILEAMSCETVIISTPVGVVPEIIENHQNGFILTENNLVSDFIMVVQKTASDLSFRQKCGVLARQTILDQFNWITSVNSLEYEEVYDLAINFFENRSYLKKIIINLRTKYYKYLELLKSKIKFRSNIKAFYYKIYRRKDY